jgi:hypothetical protein
VGIRRVGETHRLPSTSVGGFHPPYKTEPSRGPLRGGPWLTGRDGEPRVLPYLLRPAPLRRSMGLASPSLARDHGLFHVAVLAWMHISGRMSVISLKDVRTESGLTMFRIAEPVSDPRIIITTRTTYLNFGQSRRFLINFAAEGGAFR